MDATHTTSRKVAFRRHGLVLIALFLDAAAIALAVYVDQNAILLPRTPEILSLQKVLPALGAIGGGVVAIINAMAFSTLVGAHSKRVVAWEGVTFARLSQLHSLSVGAIPHGNWGFFLLGAIILICQAVLPSGIVASLTPTNAPWSTKGLRMPLADFSAASGVQVPVWCEYGASLGGPQSFGYGVNCPIDTAYGDIYTAGVESLRGTFPVNVTRAGMSYPSDLLGISGAISNLTASWVARVTPDDRRAIAATDSLNVCVPRMNVAVSCANELAAGQRFEDTETPFSGGSPRSIIRVRLCDASGSCTGNRVVSNFEGRATSIFGQWDVQTGTTTLSFYNFGEYIQSMGAANIQCKISAKEELVPIRLIGGTSAERNPSIECPTNRAQPSPKFMVNVTRLAEMSMVKMQGADGKLEPMAFVTGGDHVQALETAIRRMVSIGATEMYASVQANKALTSQWSTTVPFTYITNRTRLGDTGSHQTLLFSIAPALLLILLIVGWIYVGFRKEGNLLFDPLSPACAAAAGMNRNELSMTVAAHSTAGPDELKNLDNLIMKYTYVSNDRMGLETRGANGVDMKVGPMLPQMMHSKSADYQSQYSHAMPSPSIPYH